jgi:hypothetical protein
VYRNKSFRKRGTVGLIDFSLFLLVRVQRVQRFVGGGVCLLKSGFNSVALLDECHIQRQLWIDIAPLVSYDSALYGRSPRI